VTADGVASADLSGKMRHDVLTLSLGLSARVGAQLNAGKA
jgi:hypothetical protein